MVTIFFFSSSEVLTLNRTYQSLPEAAAVLGGLFSFLMMAGQIVSKMDKTIYLTTLLMNMLYSFQETVKNPEKQETTELTTNIFSAKSGNRESENLFEKMPLRRKSRTTDILSKEKEKISIFLKEPPPPINDFKEEMDSSKTEKDSPQKTEKEDINRGGEIMMSSRIMTKREETNKNTQIKSEYDHLPLKVLTEEEETFEEQTENNVILNEKVKSETAIGFRRRMAIRPQKLDLKIHTPRSFLGNITQHFQLKNFFKSSIKDEKELKTLKEFLRFKDKHHKIEFNFFDFLKLALKSILGLKKTFVEKLFLRAQTIFEKEIDIVKILKRIQDIEKLKYLLMSEKQIALFDVLEKPMIYLEEETPMDRSSFVLKSKRTSVKEKEDINNAYDYYLELEKKREDLQPIDQKLFMLVDKRFKTYKRYFTKKD